MSQRVGGMQRGDGELIEQSDHTQHLSIKFAVLCGKKCLEYCKTAKCDSDTKLADAFGEMTLIELLKAGLPQTFSF